VYHAIEQVEIEAFLLLSVLAWIGNRETEAAQISFKEGLAELRIQRDTPIVEKRKCTFKAWMILLKGSDGLHPLSRRS